MNTDGYIDWVALRENCAGDEGLVNEVIELFRQESDALLGDVRTAVAAKDANQVKRTAHRLKGALVSLAARPAVDAARALEVAGGANDAEAFAPLFGKLEEQMKLLLQALALSHAA